MPKQLLRAMPVLPLQTSASPRRVAGAKIHDNDILVTCFHPHHRHPHPHHINLLHMIRQHHNLQKVVILTTETKGGSFSILVVASPTLLPKPLNTTYYTSSMFTDTLIPHRPLLAPSIFLLPPLCHALRQTSLLAWV